MEIVEVGLRYDGPLHRIPERQTKFSSGMDIYASMDSNEYPRGITIEPNEVQLIPTDMYLDIPLGYEVHIRGRSGLAIKHGIMCHYGTIDADYHNEVGIILYNVSKDSYVVYDGDRIAQMFISPIINIDWKLHSNEEFELSKKGTRNGGYGSTGKT